jgi:quercetin dioxygenase-like cupin family protein
MNQTYTHIADLTQEGAPPRDGILSRTLLEDERIKVVIFGFGAGQELSEHTSSKPALLQFVQGEADLRLGSDSLQAQPGTWVHMPPGLPHSIRAKTPVVMLLVLLKTASA